MTITTSPFFRALRGGHWAYSTSGHAEGWHPVTAKVFTQYNQVGLCPSWITKTERYDDAETWACRLVVALCVIASVWVGAVALP